MEELLYWERNLATIRWIVILACASLSPLYPEAKINLFPILALGFFAILHSIGVFLYVQGQEEINLSLSYFISLVDALLIILFVHYTGGIHSPFHLLIVLSLISIALRYDLPQTVTATFAESFGYVFIILIKRQLFPLSAFAYRVSSALVLFFVTAIYVGVQSRQERRTYLRRTREVEELQSKVEELICIDDLTGLYNLSYFQERLNEEIKRTERYGTKLSLLMFDIDHFRNYNDLHGPTNGDKVLQLLGRLLKNNTRDIDIPVRYGGEEPALLLPETGKEGAFSVAERIRRLVEEEEFPHQETQPRGTLTLSCGVATYPTDAVTRKEFIDAANVAVYKAKCEGRNRVCLYSGEI